ncbi:HNH endonuclease [Pseudomonas paeninsulae]|uniref:HNH endonuclease n=1 Tax=Pseudomonas paeninsulae TaxID=3110772 RepID=UPI002D78E158|nr:hypothetical protein [Pseudomonas sp. IT1137]
MTKKTYEFDEVFSACIKGKKERKFTDHEERLNNFLRGAHKVFKVHCNYQIYHAYKDESALHGWNGKELESIYEKLRRKKSAGRFYYTKLREMTADGKCQICLYGSVESLDHYLPKESYPSLSISAHNLIPCCLSCNGKKSTHKPKTANDQTIHFKFDHYYDSNWLEAQYSHNSRRITFSPNKSNYPENSIDHKRISEHLRIHELYELYETLALKEIRDLVIRANKNNLNIKTTIESEIELIFENAKYYPNSKFTFNQWKLVTFEALLKSKDFISNGKNMLNEDNFLQPPEYDFA